MTARQWWIVVATVAGLGLAACSEPAQEAAPGVSAALSQYDAATFFETTSYIMASSGANVFSPDGADILMTSDESGVYNVYSVPVAGGGATRLTDSETSATFALGWFPGDRRLLFTSDVGGNELNHVYARATSGEVTDLTPGENVKAAFESWTADGSGLWLITNERDPQSFDLYLYATADYSRQLVYENTGSYGIGGVSRDGRWLALGKPTSSKNSNVYVVDLASDDKAVRLATEHEGDVSNAFLAFSPDSGAVIYGTDEFGEFRQAWSFAIATGERAVVAAEDWDIRRVSFSPAGRYRIVSINEDARTVARITELSSGADLVLPPLPPGDIVNLHFDTGDSKLALLLNGSTSPSNIHVVDLAAGGRRQLTEALNPAIDPAHLVAAEVVRYESYDGLAIPGILYKPHQAAADSKVPALVWVHGGPGGQSRTGYNATIQHLVNHGYAVLAANNRGSSGYGKTFFHMDDKRHGEVDLDDIVAARAYLESLAWVDGGRIGIIGGSYGGYMVGAALAFRPEVFDLGIDIFGVMNWPRTLKSIPPYWHAQRESLFDELGDPELEGERLARISPLFHAGNIVRPLLVIQGANDVRVLRQESDEIVDKVRANGVAVEYIVFDDEGHGFRSRANRITASEAYVKFLDRYLGGAEATTVSMN